MNKNYFSINDVLFYIIYTCDAPTSLHDVQRKARFNFDGVKFPKGYRKRQTELYGPKNEWNDYPEEMGMYHVKNVAVLDLNGLNKFLENSCLRYDCETMGSMTEMGLLSAKSFSNFDRAIENAYISAFIPDWRISEVIRLQTGKDFTEMDDEAKKNAQELLYKVGDTLEKTMEGVADASKHYFPYEVPEEITSALNVDFCQMALAL
jgi:hypothetical protein